MTSGSTAEHWRRVAEIVGEALEFTDANLTASPLRVQTIEEMLPAGLPVRAGRDREQGVVPLDALTLIYHRASGITHIVDAPVPEILETLGGEALAADELLIRLSERFELADADGDALTARLDELAAVGLVEQL